MTSQKVPGKLLATGGIRSTSDRVEKPILYQFPGSFNAGKATLAVQLSQKSDSCDIRYTLHMRDNYTPEYVRLNPDTMAVPTMRIDDKVITDSMEVCKYLMNNYPGPGDEAAIAAGKSQEILDWVTFAASWDEYMFTYAKMGGGEIANVIRLINLRYYLNEVLTKEPDDKEFLVNAYVNKIAGVTNMKRAQEDGEQKEKYVMENRVLLDNILARGSEVLTKNGTKFLFGDELTTGDVFFLPIFRLFQMVDNDMFEEVFGKHPNLKDYWEQALKHPGVQEGLMKYVRKAHMAWAFMHVGLPKMMLAYKLGFLKAPKLPDDLEERIQQVTEEKWKSVR